MVLKYPLLVKIGIPVLAGLVVLLHILRRKIKYKGGLRAANTRFAKALPAYRKSKRLRRLFGFLIEVGVIGSLVCGLFLAARPYRTQTVSAGTKKRDIFLCMDVSYSIYNLNYDLVDSLEDVVAGLDGDRFGISIFNTSTVLYVPMTDDYDFILKKLEEIKEYFRLQRIYAEDWDYGANYSFAGNVDDEDYWEMLEKLDTYDAGTIINNYTKGSSLIGEGLASCLYSFPSLEDEDRTRVILLSTDNAEEAISKPLLGLQEAADYCTKHDVTVFGIFPNEENFDDESTTDYHTDLQEMQKAVESTGGTFYEESRTLSVQDIVEDIQKKEALEVDEMVITKETDQPQLPFILLVSFLALAVLAGWGAKIW